MAEKDWQDIAREALTAADEPISARASDITKIGAPVVALVGTLVAVILGDQFKFDPTKDATVIAAAIVVATSIAGVMLAYAADFRTRGQTAAARFAALARIVEDDCACAQKTAAAVAAANGGPAPGVVTTDAATIGLVLEARSAELKDLQSHLAGRRA